MLMKISETDKFSSSIQKGVRGSILEINAATTTELLMMPSMVTARNDGPYHEPYPGANIPVSSDSDPFMLKVRNQKIKLNYKKLLFTDFVESGRLKEIISLPFVTLPN